MTHLPHPEQGFRSCLGILRLCKEYGADRLEAACRRGNGIIRALEGPELAIVANSRRSQFPMIDNPEARRFPSPWIAEETDACFIIRDHSGYALAYVYFEDEPGRRVAAHPY